MMRLFAGQSWASLWGWTMLALCGAGQVGCQPLADPSQHSKRRVSAYLHVSQADPSLNSTESARSGAPTTDKEFSIFKQTLAAYVHNPFVLNAALKKPGIASLGVLASQTDPLAWLQREIHVEPSDSEVVEIWMRSDRGDKQEIAQTLNAVVEALIDEFGDKAKRDLAKHLRDLDMARAKVARDLSKNAGTIQSLRENLGTSSPEQAQQEHQFLMMVLRELYANERTLQKEILVKQVEIQQLRAQQEAPIPGEAAPEVREYAERDPRLLELTRQWGETQRRQFEAEIAGNEQELAKLQTLNDKLTGAIEQRLSVARDAAKAALAEQAQRNSERNKAEIARVEQAQTLYETQLSESQEQKNELESRVAKAGKVSNELQRYEAEQQVLQEHFKKIDAEMLVRNGQLEARARVRLLQAATAPTE